MVDIHNGVLFSHKNNEILSLANMDRTGTSDQHHSASLLCGSDTVELTEIPKGKVVTKPGEGGWTEVGSQLQ